MVIISGLLTKTILNLFYDNFPIYLTICTFKWNNWFYNISRICIRTNFFESESIIDGKTRKNTEMNGFIDGFLDTERNLSNTKRYSQCAKEILRNFIDIVHFRYEKFERMLDNGKF